MLPIAGGHEVLQLDVIAFEGEGDPSSASFKISA